MNSCEPGPRSWHGKRLLRPAQATAANGRNEPVMTDAALCMPPPHAGGYGRACGGHRRWIGGRRVRSVLSAEYIYRPTTIYFVAILSAVSVSLSGLTRHSWETPRRAGMVSRPCMFRWLSQAASGARRHPGKGSGRSSHWWGAKVRSSPTRAASRAAVIAALSMPAPMNTSSCRRSP
ncbi:hypothetical protein DSM110093_02610 [Sulfitobacter sp. DSM 110093]|nr:hypothetical protein DSM110093_02610 [Sulfitobacter sp. DSM 110093]